MDGLLNKIQPIISASASSLWSADDLPKVVFSFGFMIVVLFWLSLIYRGGAGDEEIEKPVSLCLLPNCEESMLVLAPRHLKERATHDTKAPRVEFYLQGPGFSKYSHRALIQPMRLSIRGRNSASVYDHEYARDIPTNERVHFADGGQLGINSETRDKLEKYFAELFRRDGRRFDADTATFVIRLKYPMSLNLNYLLREHPDPSVRVGAWIFILTSIFSIVQEWIFQS
jgi:hypothetical protein